MTPRPYFSWTQYDCFGRSPKRWKEIYLLNRPGAKVITPAMSFGKIMAERREKNEYEAIKYLELFLPKYPHREYEMTCSITLDQKEVILLGKFDGVDLKKHIIGDDKTGKKWTQGMVDKNEQLTWYAFIYWKKKGIIPRLQLNWIETREVSPGIIEATGKIETFETRRTPKDFIILVGKIQKRWRDILKLCENEWSLSF